MEHLRSTYPDYGRIKQQPFATAVRKAVESSSKKRKHQNQGQRPHKSPPPRSIFRDESEAEEELCRVNSSRKKPKKVSEIKQRLHVIENPRLPMNRRRNNQDTTSTDTSDDSDEDEDDRAVSTSEDAIYGQKLEPEFDLMKSMLRANYSGSRIVREEEKTSKEKNIEVEVVPTKPKGMIDAVCGSDVKGTEVNGLSSASQESTVTIDGKEGPRFRDLGGMRDVLEELKMEVIVPLYHPQLLRTLGVRPMSGLLLYGPPGCGKTKLAHAIANETGVPFYKISATEVVSGVSGTVILQCHALIIGAEIFHYIAKQLVQSAVLFQIQMFLLIGIGPWVFFKLCCSWSSFRIEALLVIGASSVLMIDTNKPYGSGLKQFHMILFGIELVLNTHHNFLSALHSFI